jgi:hypothetical protein
MSKIPTNNTRKLTDAIRSYLDKFPGDTICALQTWYEGLGGQGVPNPAEMDTMLTIMKSMSGWKSVGNIRYEKFGQQQSFKRMK